MPEYFPAKYGMEGKVVKEISVQAAGITVSVELNDTPTAAALWSVLPVESRVNTWGDEIYFEIPLEIEQGPDATAELCVGDVGYWPPGCALCLFFGRTPASRSDQPRAASPVNPVGRIAGDASRLRLVPDGATVRVERRM